MYLQHVKNIMASMGFRQADIARMAGLSRAAVSKWFQEEPIEDWINVETKTIMNLASSLKVSPAIFLTPRTNLKKFETRFLWDHLYTNMESFTQALIEERLPALARLVQVLGFHVSIQIVGASVIRKFRQYEKYIKPVRRKELETLWPLYHSQI